MTQSTTRRGLTVRTNARAVEYAPARKFRSEHCFHLVYHARVLITEKGEGMRKEDANCFYAPTDAKKGKATISWRKVGMIEIALGVGFIVGYFLRGCM